ncbi:MAG: GH92 family glycosyl hydrolase [Bacteroides sp.]|nr:GH92 family glycosyl hydrolase [Bacteroides sp.]
MKKILFYLWIGMTGVATAAPVSSDGGLTGYVNPYIGTKGNGHVFMGANVPFGLVQVGPTERKAYWGLCSGYNYTWDTLRGFAHTHLSGTGATDLGDILLMPVVDKDEREDDFTHEAEDTRAGYYGVTLKNSGIHAEVTATTHAAIHRYTYPESAGNRYIRLDLDFGIGDDMMHCDCSRVDEGLITGYRYSEGFCNKHYVYFAARFSEPFEMERLEDKTATWCLTFPQNKKPVLVKVGISPVSVANALQNLDEEIADWDFDRVADEAQEAWNKQLNKIQIKTDNDSIKQIFYTALYHTMVAPSVFSDRNGDYWGADGKPHPGTPGTTTYTTFSLWDTYRAAHPLMTLIHPEMQKDIAASFLQIYREQDRLPVWHLMGNETNCMVGNPGIPVLADLVLKGFPVDREEAYEALRATAMTDLRGMKELKEHGYIPCDLVVESVAKGLEYALADDGVARVARLLGKKEDAVFFHNRSRSYTHYFGKKTLFMRGVATDKTFREPFDPFKSKHRDDDYTEGNAWQYTWLVPHDVHGLVSLFPSEERFVEKLDSLFIVTGDLGAGASPDISGLIGQYAHGNEPSHHIAYMYNYVGQPWKAAERLREIMRTQYSTRPDGICGNEDVGQMSAWYVLSALGLYQVEPVGGKYIIGSPIVDEAVLNVGNGRTFRIVVHGNSDRNIYVQSARLNGKRLSKSYLSFEDIVKGGILELQMGNTPSKKWGVKKGHRP